MLFKNNLCQDIQQFCVWLYDDIITIHLQYQLLMTEAILSLYHLNSWSRLHCRRTRNNIHWILQVIGSALALAGMTVEFQLNVNHLLSIHAWTGIFNIKFN